MPKNDESVTVSLVSGLDLIKITTTDAHNFSTKAFVSLDQAETLCAILNDLLDDVAEGEMRWL